MSDQAKSGQTKLGIERRGPVGMISLRCDLVEPRLRAALDALGLAVPARRRIAAGDGGAAAWMAPDELMLFVAPEVAPARRDALAEALGAAHSLVLDVSDARAVFRLTGPSAREALAKGAPVDLAPDAFGPGDFRRTRLGQVAAAIWMLEGETFELMCARSVADFVADWLAHAARPEARPGLWP